MFIWFFVHILLVYLSRFVRCNRPFLYCFRAVFMASRDGFSRCCYSLNVFPFRYWFLVKDVDLMVGSFQSVSLTLWSVWHSTITGQLFILCGLPFTRYDWYDAVLLSSSNDTVNAECLMVTITFQPLLFVHAAFWYFRYWLFHQKPILMVCTEISIRSLTLFIYCIYF